MLKPKPKEHICPACGKSTKRIHGYRMQTIKDLPFQLKHCCLILRKRRYVCSCGKRFYEDYTFLPRYLQHTAQLTAFIASALHENRSVVSIVQILWRNGFTRFVKIPDIPNSARRFGNGFWLQNNLEPQRLRHMQPPTATGAGRFWIHSSIPTSPMGQPKDLIIRSKYWNGCLMVSGISNIPGPASWSICIHY